MSMKMMFNRVRILIRINSYTHSNYIRICLGIQVQAQAQVALQRLRVIRYEKQFHNTLQLIVARMKMLPMLATMAKDENIVCKKNIYNKNRPTKPQVSINLSRRSQIGLKSMMCVLSRLQHHYLGWADNLISYIHQSWTEADQIFSLACKQTNFRHTFIYICVYVRWWPLPALPMMN